MYAGGMARDSNAIMFLYHLADSENLYAESPENDAVDPPRWTDRLRGGAPPESFIERTVGAAASAVWGYFTSNYVVRARVELLPVRDMLARLREPHAGTLTARVREIMREHSVVDLNALADEVQRDSSLVRKIILKFLIDYIVEEMSLPIRIGREDSSESQNNS